MAWLLPNHSNAESITVGFFYGLHFECMAVGGLAALVYQNRKNFLEGMLLQLFYNKYIYMTSIAAILVLVSLAGKDMYMIVYAGFFGVIILNMATNKRNLFNLENKVTNYLGKISYGLYMYHPLAIILVINASVRLNIYGQVLLYSAAILLTVALSHVSFYYFESYFSRLRSKLIKSDSPVPHKKAALKVVKPMPADVVE
jgi:peptidoglycan/LPS O-acetylase OafA/YrhL